MQEAQEMWVQPLGQEDALEKEMATHPSILSGKSYGQRSTAGYSPWPLRVRQDWATEPVARARTHTHTFLQLPGSSDCCTLSTVRTCCSGFPGSSVGEESACSAGSPSLIPWLGRSPGGGHGSPLQHPCLENPQGQRSRAGCSPWGRREPDKTEHSTVIAVCLLSSPFLTNGFTADSLSPLHHYAGETEGALWLVSGSRKSTYRNDAEILLCFKTLTWLEEIHELFFLRKG